jgi:hypothetical protein
LTEDTAAALEEADYEKSLCPGCGQPLSESMDSDNDGAYDTKALKCFSCADQQATRDKVAKDDRGSSYGRYYITELRKEE